MSRSVSPSLLRSLLRGMAVAGEPPTYLDGILSEHAAVELHRWQAEVLGDVGVLDFDDLVQSSSLHPLRGQAAAGDCGAAPERLEARVDDVPVVVDLRERSAGGGGEEGRASALGSGETARRGENARKERRGA